MTFKPTASNTGQEDYFELTFDEASGMQLDASLDCTFTTGFTGSAACSWAMSGNDYVLTLSGANPTWASPYLVEISGIINAPYN